MLKHLIRPYRDYLIINQADLERNISISISSASSHITTCLPESWWEFAHTSYTHKLCPLDET